MKKLILAVSLLSITSISKAQWSGTNPLYTTASQSVGVGISNPSQLFEVNGNVAIKGTHLVFNSQHGVIDWGSGAFGDLYFRKLSLQGNIYSYSDKMVLTKEGRLGIGTIGLPATQTLEINGSAFVNAENEGFLVDAGGGTGRVGLMKYQNHEGVISRVAGQDFGITRTTTSDIKNGTGLIYDLYINGGGAIGIGTLNPQSPLHIATPNSLTGGLTIDHNYTGTGGHAQVTTVNNDLTRALAIYKMTGSNAALTFQVLGNGKTRIGFDSQLSGPHTDAMLTVGGTSGKLVAKQIFVTTSNWADYVFASDYKVPDLYDIEAYYKENKHLPEIPTENEVKENGINVGEMNSLLLKKIEEMTIILVKQQREIDDLKKKITD